jgi:hypothetical protein
MYGSPAVCFPSQDLLVKRKSLTQACQRPRPTFGTLACIRGTLLQGSLTLRGVFAAAASDRPVAEGTAWLQRHLQGALTTIAPVMTHVIAEQYRTAEPDAQQVRYSLC